MRSRNAAFLITACFAVLLVLATFLHIDNSAARDLQCHSLFRDAGRCGGEHRIEMRYVPPGFAAGCITSTVTMMLLIGIGRRGR